MNHPDIPIASSAATTVASSFERVELREIDLNITNRCNLNCQHCAFASGIGDTHELPLDVIRDIVEDASALGCREIHLTGGEPTIHREFEAVLRLLLEAGMFTRLISNGTMPTAKLRRFREQGLTHLLFSLDGLAESHDRIRGRAGLFERTVERAREAMRLGYHVRINAVAMQTNLHDIVPLFRLCESMGVPLFSVFLYSPTGRNARSQLDLVVQPDQWKALKRDLARACGRSATRVFVEKGYLYPDEAQPDWSAMPGRGGGCHYLSTALDYLLITGDGEVFPCALLNDKGIPYGNVHHRRLRDIIDRPDRHYLTYRSFREPAGKCAGCNEWNHCHGGCRAFVHAFHGQWQQPDPLCRCEPGEPPSFIPLCPLYKEDLQAREGSGFSEQLSE